MLSLLINERKAGFVYLKYNSALSIFIELFNLRKDYKFVLLGKATFAARPS